MSVQASYQPMSILTERKGRAGLNVPSRTQKEKRLNEEIWKKERMMNMNESTAGIFRRQRQLVVAVLTATLLATPLFTACDTGGEPQESPQGGGQSKGGTGGQWKPVDVLSRKILVEQYDGQAEFLCLCPLC